MSARRCGVAFDTAHEHNAEDMVSGAQIVPGECAGSRTGHAMEPEWDGYGFDPMLPQVWQTRTGLTPTTAGIHLEIRLRER